METPTTAAVLGALRDVIDPELGADIVELEMVRDVTVAEDGAVTVRIGLTTAGCPLRAQIQRDARQRIEVVDGVTAVTFDFVELTAEQKARTMDRARRRASEDAEQTAIPPSARVLAIASGKGGVGKSSVTVNLAVALARRGLRVGVIDADIWGFSVPRMLGLDDRLAAVTGEDGRARMRPAEIGAGPGRLFVVSMGLLVEGEESALLWRGLMLNRAVQHFLEDVEWPDDLDYVLVDMPPGTGDVAMGMARMLPRTELLVVTTPAVAAQKVAARAVTMARKNYLRVAGVIENLSAFVAPDGSRHDLFGSGGGAELADFAGVELLGSIPIEPAVSGGGDDGRPVAFDDDGPAARSFAAIAGRIVDEIAPPASMAGCTSRLLAAAEHALDQFDRASETVGS